MPPRAALSLDKNLWALPLIFALAAGLTFLLPGQAASRGLFQSPQRGTATRLPVAFQSPLRSPTPGGFQSPVRSPTPASGPTTDSGPTPQPSLPPTRPLPAPTATPVPSEAKTATAVAGSFLPPPTLSAPGAGPAAAGPLGDPRAPVPRAADPPTPDTRGTANGWDFGSLLDTATLMAGYLWLVCGIVAVAAAGAAMVWYLTRKPEA